MDKWPDQSGGPSGTAAFTHVTLTQNVSTLFVPYSADRETLIMGPSGNGTFYLAYRTDALINVSMANSITGGWMALNRRDHGELVSGPWYAFSTSGTPIIAYAEVLRPRAR